MKYLKTTFILFIFIGIFLILSFVSNNKKEVNNGKLIINEILPENKSSYESNDKSYYDLIEIYNGYDYDVNLDGYYLSDSNSNLRKWEFPNTTIKSNDYLVVYASGFNSYDEELHTNFKLNKDGETIILTDSNMNVLSKVKYSKTLSDTSYGYDGEKYVYFYDPTPNKENSKIVSLDPIKNIEKSDVKIRINNYNKNYAEIYNESDNDINLENYYISNTETNLYKYQLPSFTLKSKSKVLIYFDGLNKVDDNIHTSISYDNLSKIAILTDNQKRPVDKFLLVGSSEKEVVINEVASTGIDAIELRNLTDKDIDLSNYEITDNGDVKVSLKGVVIKANSYLVLYGSDNYYVDSNIHLGFHINNSNEDITLFKNGMEVDRFIAGKINKGISSGLNNKGEKVLFNEITMGYANSSNYYLGYSPVVKYSIDGGYVEKGEKITLSTDVESDIYYTLDGSFPTNSSTKYTGPITINKTTTIKTISYKSNYFESDVTSRTYFVGKTHSLPIVSISTNNDYLFGTNGIFTNYTQNINKKISFEYYEKDGKLGVSFVGDTKLSGMDSRKRLQKSMSIYLRKDYGLSEITYPLFKESELRTYSSFLLRNAGEDPKGIRIMDATLTQVLKEKMDIDVQDYQPVVVYVNGEYFGMYNLRDKFNADYVVTHYGYDKDGVSVIKYRVPTHGSLGNFDSIVSYISNNDVKQKDVYEYVKSKLDVQELINYVIVEAYYGNTDLGNIRYWKADEHDKWRFMLYDLDWSLWDTTRSFAYPIHEGKIPAATYYGSVYTMTRKLYQNSEFKDLYLKSVANALKNCFKPEIINALADKYAALIKDEMPDHIARWNEGARSMSSWQNSVEKFKNTLTTRYNTVVSRLKSEFNLSDSDYQKYFGDL